MNDMQTKIEIAAQKLLNTINRKPTMVIDLESALGKRGLKQLEQLLKLCLEEQQENSNEAN